ncbi:YraN family protein [Candidatus Wolfebacteria bacterium]|nr:YraN family protein [Candidatus Wolfebacteria bacterium]
MDNINIGKLGEDIASVYLMDEGYFILDKNIRKNYGEIDIIAKNSDKTLVFIEVKTMKIKNPAIAGLSPEDNLTQAKLRKFKKIASSYANSHPELIDNSKGYQLDLITISFEDVSRETIENILSKKENSVSRETLLSPFKMVNTYLKSVLRGLIVSRETINKKKEDGLEKNNRETFSKSVKQSNSLLTNILKYCDINHYKNIF